MSEDFGAEERQEISDENFAVEEICMCSANDNESCYEISDSESSHEPSTRFADDSENELSDSEIVFEEKFEENKQKMYNGCPLTLDESAVLLLQFAICHSITGKALLDLISLIKAHLPVDCLYFTYINQMKNILSKCSDIPLEITNFCDKCMHSLKEMNFCQSCKVQANETSQFIKLSIGDQIKTFFQDEQFYEHLNYRFCRKKQDEDNMEDVYGGLLYIKLFDNDGILSDRNNLSLKINTDGVAIFKSSSYHLWPVYFQINELPPEIRTQSRYRILAGLWSGKKKTNMNSMFKPIVDELQTLEDGIHVTLPEGTSVISKVIVISGHFDTPAKDDFLQKVHHNGNFGCSFCEEQGQSTAAGKGHTHVYPYNSSSNAGFSTPRTHANMVDNAIVAIRQKKPSVGIKNKCVFSNLKYFDLVNSVSVDYMHTVCLGVVKRLLSLWFGQEHKSKSFYIGNRINVINERLLKLSPPNLITRTPRSIDHLKHFKASELKNWLLHYGPVCLKGILPDTYYSHFMYLVKAVYSLLTTSISNENLIDSGRCFQSFCLLMEELYGERYMTINTHLLLHIEESVRHLGPLWTSSCFSFEDYNGQLSSFFHGTQNVNGQILNAVAFSQKLPFYRDRLSKENKIASDLLESLSNKGRVSLKEKLSDGVYVLGGKQKKLISKLSHEVQSTLQSLLQVPENMHVEIFYRVFMHGSPLHSAAYTRTFKRNSYTVKFLLEGDKQYGQILFFFKLAGETSNAVIRLLEKVEHIKNEHIVLHVTKVHTTENMFAVPLNNIVSKCVFLDCEDEQFVSDLPNTSESD